MGEKRKKNVPDWDPRKGGEKGDSESKLQWQKVVIFRPSELEGLNFIETVNSSSHKCLVPNTSKLDTTI